MILICGLIIITLFAPNAEQLFAQTIFGHEFRHGVVNIYFESEKTGLGFLCYETNQEFYFATAKHIVSKDKTIHVQFHYGGEVTEAAIFDTATFDLAILKSKKVPTNGIVWRGGLAKPVINNKVRFWGRNVRPVGSIVKVTEDTLIIKSTGARRGSSGSPIMGSNGIVGMVTEDEGEIVFAIPAEKIHRYIVELFKVDYLRIKDLPYFTFDGLVGWGGTGIDAFLNIFKEGGQGFFYAVGSSVTMTSRFGAYFRFGRAHFTGRKGEIMGTQPPSTLQLRNIINELRVGINLDDMSNTAFINIFYDLHYTLIFSNPKFNFNNSGWQRLSKTAVDHEDVVHALGVGLGLQRVDTKYKFGFFVNFGYTFSGLYPNVKSPLLKDWSRTYFEVGINGGYVLRKKQPKIIRY